MSTRTIKIISCNGSKTKCQAVILTPLKNGKKKSRTVHCVRKQEKWIAKIGENWIPPKIKVTLTDQGMKEELIEAGRYEPVFDEIEEIAGLI